VYLIVTQSSTVLGDTCENAKDVRNMVRAQCPGLYGKVVAIALARSESVRGITEKEFVKSRISRFSPFLVPGESVIACPQARAGAARRRS